MDENFKALQILQGFCLYRIQKNQSNLHAKSRSEKKD